MTFASRTPRVRSPERAHASWVLARAARLASLGSPAFPGPLGSRLSLVALLGLSVAGLSACGDGAPDPVPPTPSTPASQPDEPAPEVAPDPAGPSAQGNSFQLNASGSESYAAGEVGQFSIELTGRDGWHVNLEYPTVVQLEGEGVTFPNARLEQAQAAAYEEARVRFDVPFTAAAAGEHRATARVQFAMCNPSNCVPEERTLALPLAVR